MFAQPKHPRTHSAREVIVSDGTLIDQTPFVAGCANTFCMPNSLKTSFLNTCTALHSQATHCKALSVSWKASSVFAKPLETLGKGIQPGAHTVILDEEWGVNNPSEDQNRHKAVPLHYHLHDLQRFVPVPRHIPPPFGAS
jgi:hypothetical protein